MRIWDRGKKRAEVALAAVLSLLLVLVVPVPALAMSPQDVRVEFSDGELQSLFIATNYDSCEFVMHDFDTGDDVYLKVRDEYRERYEQLVGADSVDIMSLEGGAETLSGKEDALEMIEDPLQEPWCNVLYLGILHLEDSGIVDEDNSGQGSAFLVPPKVALTAAHCVYTDGKFAYCIDAEVNVGGTSLACPCERVGCAVVSKSWVEHAGEGTEDRDHDYAHDFAVIVFDETPEGASESSLFSYDSISVADSFGMVVNCLGYAIKEGETEAHLWRNSADGSISKIDFPFPLGNCFQMNLVIIGGMSGGPVYYVDDSRYVAVGINSSSSLWFHYACRITERCQVLVAWAQEEGWLHVGTGTGGGVPHTGGSLLDLYRREWAREEATS